MKNAVKGSVDIGLGVEVSPVGDSKANGEVERAIKTVQGQVRTLKSALEEHYKTTFSEEHVMLPWLIAYASSLVNKFSIGEDGKTGHERARGRKFNRPLPEFGECVMFAKALPKKNYNKLEAQWESGVFLGINDLSQELIMGTSEGAIKATEFRHKGSEEESWNFDEMNNVKGLPWQPDPNTAGMEVKARIILPMEAPMAERINVETKPTIVRGVALKKAEYLAMGATPNCNGCKAIARGDLEHKPHSQECRERAVEWLKRQDDERVQARLTAAQMRQEAHKREEESKRKKEEE